MIDASVLRMFLIAVTGWLAGRKREIVAYLIEENRVLRRQVGRRLRLNDEDRRKLAARTYRVGRLALRNVATIVCMANSKILRN